MKSIIPFLFAFLFTSCGNCQGNQVYSFKKTSPVEVQMHPNPIDRLVTDIESEKVRNIHGLYIIKDDRLVTEAYFNGHKRQELHYVASVTKSFASALLGIAIDQGYFGSDIPTVLNQKVSELFPEYATIILQDSSKSDLRLRHILSMTAGFEWDEHTHPYTDSRNDCNRINNSQDPMKFLFEKKLVHTPGSDFYYNGGLSLSISWLIQKYTGMRVDQFAEKHLFKALGIKNYQWERVEGGLSDTDGGLHLTLADQAKLGYLFLKGGKWQGRQIVSEEWVRETVHVQQLNAGMPDYGYQWWCGEFHAMGRKFNTYMASGHGGQKVLVLPDYNTVVVIAQQVFHNDYGDLNFLAILSDYIIPSLTEEIHVNDRIVLSRNELEKYEGRYLSECEEEYIDAMAGDGHLILNSSNGEQNEIIAINDLLFAARIMELLTVQIEFLTGEDDKISGFSSRFGYSEREFWKSD